MPNYAAGQVRLETGVLGSSTMAPLQGVTNIRADWNANRANVNVMNRGKPLEQRPIVNYILVDVQVDYIHRDTTILQCLGLVNPTGVAMLLTDTKAATATYGIRSMQVLYAPTNSANYNGQLDLKSGVLTSFGLQGGVTEPVRGSFTLQCLDMSGSVNTTARDTTNYAASLVKPENQQLTGIQFTGYGITGVTIQSFSFNIGFTHAAVQQLGLKYPIERPLTDVSATLQVQGFFEGINNSVTGLTQYDCGNPSFGIVGITLQPNCAGNSAGTITIKNPYIDSYSIDGQVGNFSTISISLSMPLGPNPLETTDGSVVTIT